MHSTQNFSHILFNMFALWMFGNTLENVWGSEKATNNTMNRAGTNILTKEASKGMVDHEVTDKDIKKEDEILYHWMDRNLSITQIGRLYSRFNAKDQKKGDPFAEYEAIIKTIEEKFRKKEGQNGKV